MRALWHRVASTDLLALNGTPTASVARPWAAISPPGHAPRSPTPYGSRPIGGSGANEAANRRYGDLGASATWRGYAQLI